MYSYIRVTYDSGIQFTFVKNIRRSFGVHRGSKGGGLNAGLGCLIDRSAACLGGAEGLALPREVGVVLSMGWGAVTGLALPREVGVVLSIGWGAVTGLALPRDVGVVLSIGWGTVTGLALPREVGVALSTDCGEGSVGVGLTCG